MNQKKILKLLVNLFMLNMYLSDVYQDPMYPFCQRISNKKKREYLNRVTLGKGSFGTVTQSSSRNVVKILDFFKDKKDYEKNFTNILEEIIFMYDIKKAFPDIKDIQVLQKCFYEDNQNDKVLKFYLEQEKLSLDFRYMVSAKKDWPFEWYLSMIKKITQSLEKLHKAGYAHLDIKPENIMMADIETPVLIDFGFVEYLWGGEVSASTKSNKNRKDHYVQGTSVKGSPKFIAPEIWFQNLFSFSSDFYALGVSVIEMMNPNQSVYSKSIQTDKQTKFLEMVDPLENVFDNNKETIFDQSNGYAPFFNNLIKGLIKTDAAERFYIEDVFKELEKIKKNWIEFCKNTTNKSLPVCQKNLSKAELQKIADELTRNKKKKTVLL